MRRSGPPAARKRANVLVLLMVSVASLLGAAALAIDIGRLYMARTELQSSADAAALAGAWELLDSDRLRGASHPDEEFLAARDAAVAMAARNPVLQGSPLLDRNTGNTASGDIVIGYLSNPLNHSEVLSLANPAQFNTVQVRVRRNAIRNGLIHHLFAPIFGNMDAGLGADAMATFKDGVVGFRVTDRTGNAGILPLALHVDYWTRLLAGTYSVGDNYSYNEETGVVSSGGDGINELNLYPGSGGTQLPPGNFGTVDIGSPNNSTADLSRQIREGVSEADLAYFPGGFRLNDAGELELNGDTGLSAAIKDDLESVLGQPRTIPLFNRVTGNGNNSMFRVIGFAGVRIMNVRLTGAMRNKQVIIQPAFVVDDAALTEPGSGSSYFVYQPVRLSR